MIVDLVPNHTSDEHPWFRAALAAGAGQPASAPVTTSGPASGADGAEPPNNWPASSAARPGPRVARDGAGEWYLHLFAPEQPDLELDATPRWWADLEKTLRFWLDRGVDGFRIDVAHGMCKPEGCPTRDAPAARRHRRDPRFDHDDVHDVHRMIRPSLDHYPQRMAIGAVWVRDAARFARYVRPDELHLAVDTQLAASRFDAEEVRAAIEDCLNAVGSRRGRGLVAAVRPRRVAAGLALRRRRRRPGPGPGDGAGAARAARRGLPLQRRGAGAARRRPPDEARRTRVAPRAHRAQPRRLPRAACRGRAGRPAYGFTTGEPWLPIPDDYARLAPPRSSRTPDSTLSLYRRALELRREHPGFAAPVAGPALEWFGAPPGCLAFRRTGTTLVCALNTSAAPVPLPPGDPLLVSGPLDDGMLPPDTAVWLA